jgi:hypothetical protein
VLAGHQHLGRPVPAAAAHQPQQTLGQLEQQGPLQLGQQGLKGWIAEQRQVPGRQGLKQQLLAGGSLWKGLRAVRHGGLHRHPSQNCLGLFNSIHRAAGALPA